MKTAADALIERCRRNGRVSGAAFRTLTDPGQGDPKLKAMGYNLRQMIDGQETYSLTINVNGHLVTPITFTRIGQMMRVSRNGGYEVTEFSYEAVAELNEQIRAKYPGAAWPEPVEAAETAIPFQGEPIEQTDDSDLGLQPEA